MYRLTTNVFFFPKKLCSAAGISRHGGAVHFGGKYPLLAKCGACPMMMAQNWSPQHPPIAKQLPQPRPQCLQLGD